MREKACVFFYLRVSFYLSFSASIVHNFAEKKGFADDDQKKQKKHPHPPEMQAWVTVWEGTETGIPAPMPDSRAMLDVLDSWQISVQGETSTRHQYFVFTMQKSTNTVVKGCSDPQQRRLSATCVGQLICGTINYIEVYVYVLFFLPIIG